MGYTRATLRYFLNRPVCLRKEKPLPAHGVRPMLFPLHPGMDILLRILVEILLAIGGAKVVRFALVI